MYVEKHENRFRLGVGFSLILLLIAGIGIFATKQMTELASLTNKLYRHPLAVSNAVLEANGNIIAMDRSMKDVVLAKENRAIDRTVSRLDDYEKKVYKSFELVKERYLGDMQSVNEAIEAFTAWRQIRNEVIDLMRSGKGTEAAAIMKGKDAAHVKLLNEKMAFLINFARHKADEFMTKVKATEANTIKATYWLLVAVVLVAIGIATFLVRSISKPVMALASATLKVSEGDLSISLAENSNDEIGEVSRNFNVMVENIRGANEALEAEKATSQAQSDRLSSGVVAMVEAVETFSATNEASNLPMGDDEIGTLNNVFNTMTRATQSANEALNSEKAEADRKGLYLANSVRAILTEMEKLAEGDLTVQLPIDGDDDIAQLFAGFNRSVGNIRQLMGNVLEVIHSVVTATTEISHTTQEMASGSQKQSSQTSEVAGAVEEMSRTVSENAKNAMQTVTAARENGEVAKNGNAVVDRTVEKIRQIANVVESSSETVLRLGRSSEKIGEIILVINEIADQTNLLALNAAIEAARAGEQGRGFAVVADEVRKLAERTTQSTKEISETIKAIQKETVEAVEAMKRGNVEVAEGITLADEAGSALTQVVSNMEDLVDLINQIATASEEQSATTNQVAQNVEVISGVAEQSASGLHQVAQSTEGLNQLIVNLQGLLSKFDVGSSDSGRLAIQG